MARPVPDDAPTRDNVPDDASRRHDPDALLDVEEAARWCRLRPRTLQNAVTRGDLVPDGRARGALFTVGTLRAWLRSRVKRRGGSDA